LARADPDAARDSMAELVRLALADTESSLHMKLCWSDDLEDREMQDV
jgi:hypothetical protein